MSSASVSYISQAKIDQFEDLKKALEVRIADMKVSFG